MTRPVSRHGLPLGAQAEGLLRVRLGRHGRLVVPALHRKALGLEVGSDVLLRLRDGKLELFPAASGLAAARRLMEKHRHPGRSLSRELLAERRKEAERG